MTNRPVHDYEIIMSVQRRYLLTVPVGDTRVVVGLDPRLVFARQIARTLREDLARIQAELGKARTS
jgi:hypothetical protein